MKGLLKGLAIVAMVSALAACGEPTLDTSSDQAMKESVQKIMSELPADQKKQFKTTLTAMYTLAIFGRAAQGGTAAEGKALIDKKLNGKTAKEIFAIADEVRKKMKQ